MKKLLILLVGLLAFAGAADAQYIINNIGYTPLQTPQITSQHVDYNLNNGCRFSGTCWYHNGQVNRYQGDMYFPDGRILSGNYTPNFGYQTSTAYTLKNPDNSMFKVRYNEYGNETWRQPYNPPMTIDPGTAVPGFNPNGGYTNPVDDHRADCRQCSTTGRCRRCGGLGYLGGGRPCEECNHTGKCRYCNGKGWSRI